MNTFRSKIRSTAIAVAAFALISSELVAQPMPQPAYDGIVVNVQADCYSIGQQVAAQQGGTLAKASASNQGGQPVCVIVVLVPGKDGQRPRRQEFVIPQN